MPVSTKPTDLAREMAAGRQIYALWHREEAPARQVVEKFALKLARYPRDRQQRPLVKLGFESQNQAGTLAMPDPQQDSDGADAYLRQALSKVEDVVVFYSDLLGNDGDPVGRRTGRELEFFCDPLMLPALRFWFGRVHDIDTTYGQIGRCALNAIPWTYLPGGTARFSLRDPDGAMDSEVGQSVSALLSGAPPAGGGAATEGAAQAASPSARAADEASVPPAPARGWLQRLWPFGRPG